jgi:hypothetical protein
MLCCEVCEKWSHAACYRIKKSEVPDAFFCDTCRPPVTELVFDDVTNVALREALEHDRDAFGFKPGAQRKRVKPANEILFKHEERVLLEKYWKMYARADEEDRPLMAEQIGRLFCLSRDSLEEHFVLMAEDVLDGALRKSVIPKQPPPGRAATGRRNTLTKSVTGVRTIRSEIPVPSDRRCNNDGGKCEECHCRMNRQECLASQDETLCLQCGCALPCSNSCLSMGVPAAPYACIPFEFGWRYVSVDVIKPGGFVCEVQGKVCDESAVIKGSWTSPLKHDCRELFVRDLGLMWEQEKHGNDARFIRRSCTPNCEVRWVWVGKELRLGVWALAEEVQAGQEVTVAWDRPWDSLVCHVECACESRGVCQVRQWYGERQQLASSLAVVQERVGTRRAEQQRPTKLQAELETTLNPLVTPENKLSREERKLQQVLKTIEKLEKSDKQGSADGTPQRKRSRHSVSSDASAATAAAASATAAATTASTAQTAIPQADSEVKKTDDTTVVVAAVPPILPPVAAAAASTTSSSTPNKSFGGKKAWMQKFNDGDIGSPLPPAPVVLPELVSPPTYGWKKRAMLNAPEPFLLETLEPEEKKAKEESK